MLDVNMLGREGIGFFMHNGNQGSLYLVKVFYSSFRPLFHFQFIVFYQIRVEDFSGRWRCISGVFDQFHYVEHQWWH